jgi:hypothetical protein
MSKALEGTVNWIKYSLSTVTFPFMSVCWNGAGVFTKCTGGFSTLQMTYVPTPTDKARMTKRIKALILFTIFSNH